MLLFDSEETTDRLVVLFDLDNKSMTIIDRVTERFGIGDMNEHGDMIVLLKESGEQFYWLYSFPFTNAPQLLSRSENDGERAEALNGNRQVVINHLNEKLSMIRDPNGEVTIVGNKRATHLDEDGFAYADSDHGPDGLPI